MLVSDRGPTRQEALVAGSAVQRRDASESAFRVLTGSLIAVSSHCAMPRLLAAAATSKREP